MKDDLTLEFNLKFKTLFLYCTAVDIANLAIKIQNPCNNWLLVSIKICEY